MVYLHYRSTKPGSETLTTVILSAAGSFACERTCVVEGPMQLVRKVEGVRESSPCSLYRENALMQSPASDLLLPCYIGIRIDRGIQTGDQVSSQFSPFVLWKR